MLPDHTIAELALQLTARAAALEGWLRDYQWKTIQLAQAWPVRRQLQYDRFGGDNGAYADAVHRWGFGSPVPAAIRNHRDYGPALAQLCHVWGESAQPWVDPAAMDALRRLLSIHGCKIARVSKFVCFLNQEALAIYDSRVSYALKALCLQGRRVFPFVAGRPAPAGKGPYVGGDAAMTSGERSATAYVDFLRLLQHSCALLNGAGGLRDKSLHTVLGTPHWTPALLEMALFMEGQERNTGADIAPPPAAR